MIVKKNTKQRSRNKNGEKEQNKLRPNVWTDKPFSFSLLVAYISFDRILPTRMNRRRRKKNPRFFSPSFDDDIPVCCGWLLVFFSSLSSYLHSEWVSVFCLRCIREPIYILNAYIWSLRHLCISLVLRLSPCLCVDVIMIYGRVPFKYFASSSRSFLFQFNFGLNLWVAQALNAHFADIRHLFFYVSVVFYAYACGVPFLRTKAIAERRSYLASRTIYCNGWGGESVQFIASTHSICYEISD